MTQTEISTLASDQIAIANRIVRRAEAGDESVDHDALRLAELVLEANAAKVRVCAAGGFAGRVAS